jgi:D-beta-D-heptose 7-phosphate kinase/D-beta-D-heptose 1-phosphate adenosyltransferase
VKISVFGDLMLDVYHDGTVVKPNPESNGAVIRVTDTAYQLGGAAAVGMLCQCLGAQVTLGGVLGDDPLGTRLRTMLDRRFGKCVHVTHRLDEVTTTKIRTLVDGRLRPDRIDVEQRTSAQVCDGIYESRLGDLVVVQDYGKGVITEASMNVLRLRCERAGVPFIVDPAKDADWSIYRGAMLIKANLAEAKSAAGEHILPRDCAPQLARRYKTTVVVTFGANGMAWDTGVRGGSVPAVLPESVNDVCGCGDTVIATLAVALARGLTIERACEIAAVTASQQVSQWGVGPISCEELRNATTPPIERVG